MAMKAPKDIDITRGIAITTSFHVDEVTHVENCRYGKGSNLMGALATLMVEDDPTLPPPGPGQARWRRPVQFAREVAKQPLAFGRTLVLRTWSERTVIALVMQSLDNSLVVRGKLRTGLAARVLGKVRLTSTQGHGQPNPTWFPQASAGVRAMSAALSKQVGGRVVLCIALGCDERVHPPGVLDCCPEQPCQ